jgi:hypothetical protein
MNDSRKPTLKELLSAEKDLPAMDMEPIRRAFDNDEDMPQIDESQHGRLRLHAALAAKYGPSYESVPRVRDALTHYEKESKFLNIYKRTMGARYGR